MPTCVHCGKLLADDQEYFCSLTCRNHYQYIQRNSTSRKARPRASGTRQTCEICGKPLGGRQTRFCSVDCKNLFHQAYANQKKRGLRRKLELVQMLGGRCMQCGYDKNLAALSFHHEDEDEKNHQLDMRSLSNRRIEAVMREFEKCILLCANCHMELHYPYLDMDKVSLDNL